jgi:hypothetical protein
MSTYYRGGASLAPRPIDVIINRKTGLVMPGRGVSVSNRPDGLDRFGGTYEVGPIPSSLEVVKVGRNPHHFEIAPRWEMTFEQYTAELARVTLTKV